MFHNINIIINFKKYDVSSFNKKKKDYWQIAVVKEE